MKKQLFLLVMMLLPMVAMAAAVEIDGVYYNLYSEAKTAEVTSNPNKYSGSVAIPEKVQHEGTEYSVTGIGKSAFSGCSGLTSIIIPNSVTSIGGWAFYGCSGLTSITIPNSVTKIEVRAFEGCSGLQKVIVNDIAAWFGINFSDNYSNPLIYAHHLYSDENTEITEIIIPNSVTSIGNYAFYICSGLTSITIPNSVTNIGSYAFVGCNGLTSVNIPNSVTSIGNYAFFGCHGLTSIIIPNSVTTLGESAFQNCNKAKNLTLPETLQIIKKSTFNNCSSFTEITIPAAVEYIYQEAFSGCSSLAEIKALPTAPPFAYSNTFSNYSATLKVPEEGKDAYLAHDVWSKFEEIQTLEKCATPTIKYIGGKLLFECETEGVEFVYSITTPANATNQTGNNVDMPHTNIVSVYAKKEGYLNSDVATENIDVRGIQGDTNRDGVVTVADAVGVVNIILEKNE